MLKLKTHSGFHDLFRNLTVSCFAALNLFYPKTIQHPPIMWILPLKFCFQKVF